MFINTPGLIIRETKVGDNSKCLTVLSPEYGLMTVWANRARSMRSKMAASTQFLTYSQFVIEKKNENLRAQSVELIEPFLELRDNIEALTLAHYIVELLRTVSVERGDSECDYIRLALNTLHVLCKRKISIDLIKPVFELRLMTLAGFMPDLDFCFCGAAPEFFIFGEGCVACLECSSDIPYREKASVSFGVLSAMKYITNCELNKIFSFSLNGESLGELNNIAENYVKYMLDKDFNTLKLYKEIKGT